MKIILTGAGGALGGPVAAALSSAGEALILLGRTTARSPRAVGPQPTPISGAAP